MSDVWYEVAEANTKLTQGDIIFDCPLVSWSAESLELEHADEVAILEGATEVIQANVVVMTQACDLEYEKVRNVVLCPLFPFSDYKFA